MGKPLALFDGPDLNGWVTVRTPYKPEWINDLKTMVRSGDRKWDADRKCWLVDEDEAAHVAALCVKHGMEPWGSWVDEYKRTHPGAGAGAGAGTGAGGNGGRPGAGGGGAHAKVDGVPWEALFAGLPPHLREKAFRAMALVVHPDAGGDTVLMQQLNAARPQKHTG